MIMGIKVIFGFLFFVLCGGFFFYIILDLKPWRKRVCTKLWKEARIPNPAWPYLKNKKKK